MGGGDDLHEVLRMFRHLINLQNVYADEGTRDGHALENGQFDMTFPAEGHPKSKSVFRVRRSSSSSGQDAFFLEPK